MGRNKCAYDCEHASDSDVKYFKFPVYNPRRLKKWLANMKWEDWSPSRFSVLCIDHFEEHHIDRSGKFVKLREDAVPTVFSAPGDAEQRKVRAQPSSISTDETPTGFHQILPVCLTQASSEQRRRSKADKGLPSSSAAAKKKNPSCDEWTPSSEDTGDKWRIIIDTNLMKIDSFPHFFHGDYCATQDIVWAPDSDVSRELEDPEKVLEVTEAWQWLGLDMRGPLSGTAAGNRYVLTVTDLFSQWVESVALEACLPSLVAQHLADIIQHFGFPVRILSRLPRDAVDQVGGATGLWWGGGGPEFRTGSGFAVVVVVVADQLQTEAATQDLHRPRRPSLADGHCRRQHAAAAQQDGE
ncbi:uncharacterized protein LOC142898494 isoform X2 [Nelusetta ayraudi]|uniref:uncharacterized protein LOC142898494 isoform X2 n=1 Tax=Nelusetta ayraudi TaxID=303726 RepID=UPI003F713FE9